MSRRSSPTCCHDRSSPSRAKPQATAARHDPSFHGSTCSSRRATSSRLSAQSLRARSAAPRVSATAEGRTDPVAGAWRPGAERAQPQADLADGLVGRGVRDREGVPGALGQASVLTGDEGEGIDLGVGGRDRRDEGDQGIARDRAHERRVGVAECAQDDGAVGEARHRGGEHGAMRPGRPSGGKRVVSIPVYMRAAMYTGRDTTDEPCGGRVETCRVLVGSGRYSSLMAAVPDRNACTQRGTAHSPARHQSFLVPRICRWTHPRAAIQPVTSRQNGSRASRAAPSASCRPSPADCTSSASGRSARSRRTARTEGASCGASARK